MASTDDDSPKHDRVDARGGSASPVRVKRSAEATGRNVKPIISVLTQNLPPEGGVLEVGSGTGQHAIAFARAFPALTWRPSDPDPLARGSILAWMDEAGLANIDEPLDLDLTAPGWHKLIAPPVDAILAINVVHISPWSTALGLMHGAGALLAPGGLLYLYGPFMRDGAHTAPSNAAFDRWLREENPAWGVRDISDVEAEAVKHGLILAGTVEMPANNLSLVFRKA